MMRRMAKHGDHPELPQILEDCLQEDVHTVFLKADCPVRVKRGTIGKLKLVELDEVNDGQWDKLRLESLEEELQLSESNDLCPTLLIKRGNKYMLYNKNMPEEVGENPIFDHHHIHIAEPNNTTSQHNH